MNHLKLKLVSKIFASTDFIATRKIIVKKKELKNMLNNSPNMSLACNGSINKKPVTDKKRNKIIPPFHLYIFICLLVNNF